MQLRRLVVESFQAIVRADIEFGPGLNILYGPNDLGKSTLARAIRAALLLPPTSSEAGQFLPWQSGTAPRVSLTFIDADDRHWRVIKVFGEGAQAELQFSKDGASFTADCRARQVEEKIRAQLGWGIPAPGGRGGPKGFPPSFLANALLAAQTDVDTILGASLAQDLEVSGKIRLTKALAALAQDPLLKKVLDTAQAEVDASFSQGGRRKKGQASKFKLASDAIKRLEDERIALQRQADESMAIEKNVVTLRERRVFAITRVDDATAALVRVRQLRQQALEREAARGRLETAGTMLADIDAHAARVAATETDVEKLASAVRAQEQRAEKAASEYAFAETAVRRAEDAHRASTSEEGTRQRELRRAQLEAQAAMLAGSRQAAEMRKAKIEAAIAAVSAEKTAQEKAEKTRTEVDVVTQRLGEARERATNLGKDAQIAAALVAYGRWRTAMTANEQASTAKAAARADRSSAEARDTEATALDARASEIDSLVSARMQSLPREQELQALSRLERELERAEAALGGGLSVTVRPRSSVGLRVLADQKEVVNEDRVSQQRIVEAERRVQVSVGDLIEIEVTAGGTEQRRVAEGARTKWNAEAVPALERAGVKSLADLVKAHGEPTRLLSTASDLRKEAGDARAETKRLRDRATLQEDQAAHLSVDAGELEERQKAIGPTPTEILDMQFSRLGKAWEAQAVATHARKDKELQGARVGVVDDEKCLAMATYQLSEAEEAVTKIAAATRSAVADLGSVEPPQAQLKATVDELASVSRTEAALASELQSLTAAATTEVEAAHRALETAQQSLLAAQDARMASVTALDAARAKWNGRIGERNVLATQLEAMDRGAAEAALARCKQDLDALPSPRLVSDADVDAAMRQVEQLGRDLEFANEELHKAEGALSKVGGAAIREEVTRIDEALAAARVRERELELDAGAWKLLLDTLRAVENEEGAHLGRALAGPVTAKFGELTQGRYAAIRLDPVLKAEAVEVPGGIAQGVDVLDALSVGTRNQLATLIRLTIADQLRTAIVLDDHLVHTDPTRLGWFRDVLMKTALNAQVIVLTCRPEDYLSKGEFPAGTATRDVAGGAVRAIDAAALIRRADTMTAQPLAVAQ